jgi:tetratricopeptide (TPR) repeat protein
MNIDCSQLNKPVVAKNKKSQYATNPIDSIVASKASFETAQAHLSREDIPRAALFFEEARQKRPDWVEPYGYLEAIFLKQKNDHQLIKLYRRALRHFPEWLEIHFHLAEIYLESKFPERARKYLDIICAAQPEDLEVRQIRAKLAFKSHDYAQACADYLKIYEYHPLNGFLLTLIGACYLMQGNLAEAARRMAQSVDLEQTQENLTYTSFINYQIELLRKTNSPFHNLPQATNQTLDIALFTFPPMGLTGGGQQPEQLTQVFQGMGHRVMYYHQFLNFEARDLPGVAVIQDLFMMNTDSVPPYFIERLNNVLNEFTQSPEGQRIALFTMISPALNSYIPLLRKAGYKIAYWCLDDWEAMGWPNVPANTEVCMIEAADYLMAVSKPLVTMMEKHAQGKPVYYIPNGFNRKCFPNQVDKPPMPEDLVKGQELTFIYWGNLVESWLDWDLLTAVAQAHPKWSFNLIGAVEKKNHSHNDRTYLPNVHYLGEKRVEELYPYGCHSDIAFIHFKNNQLIRAVSPIKSFEYLACGLPVISSPMPELDMSPNTFQVRTPQEFEEAVEHIRQQGLLGKSVDEAYLSKTSWEQRAKTFLEIMR